MCIEMLYHEFPPVFDRNSRVLILGSFPSVKSRKISFYYGNRQNRFWKMLFGYFHECVQESTEDKISFLLRHGVALWDIVQGCEIEGSSDSTIRAYEIADLARITDVAQIQKILLNGTTAFRIFEERYSNFSIPYVKMPSTSPANPRYDAAVWEGELDGIFRTDRTPV